MQVAADTLTKARAYSLVTELLTQYGTAAFQRRLQELVDAMPGEHGSEDLGHVPGRKELCLTVQQEVLPYYGFEATEQGLVAMTLAVQKFLDEPEMLAKVEETHRLLRLPPMKKPSAGGKSASGAGKGSKAERKLRFTRARAVSMLTELKKGFSVPTFQSRLALMRTDGPEAPASLAPLLDAIRTVQQGVLPGFGFEASEKGVSKLLDDMQVFASDAQVQPLVADIEGLAGMSFKDFMMATEGFRFRLAPKLPGQNFRSLQRPAAMMMTVPWAGGPCQHVDLGSDDEEKAKSPRTPGGSLRVNKALELLSALLEAFSAPGFQKRLSEIRRRCQKDMQLYTRQRRVLVRVEQAKILPHYGFKATDEGVKEMLRAFDAPLEDDNVLILAGEIDEVLYGEEFHGSVGLTPVPQTRMLKKSVLSILRNMNAELASADFQAKIQELKEAARRKGQDDDYDLAGRGELAMTVQARVLPQYGYRADRVGLHMAVAQISDYIHHREVMRLLDRLNGLLGMSPESCKRFRDTVDISSNGPLKNPASPKRAASKGSPAAETAPAAEGPPAAKEEPQRSAFGMEAVAQVEAETANIFLPVKRKGLGAEKSGGPWARSYSDGSIDDDSLFDRSTTAGSVAGDHSVFSRTTSLGATPHTPGFHGGWGMEEETPNAHDSAPHHAFKADDHPAPIEEDARHEEEEEEDALADLAPEPLTRARAMGLLSELLWEFSAKTFQTKLKTLIDRALVNGSQDLSCVPGRDELAWTVQREVLPRYGFSGDQEGMEELQQALEPMLDATMLAKLEALDRKLHIPKTSTKSIFSRAAGAPDGHKHLTKARILALQHELLAGFTDARFQQQLNELYETRGDSLRTAAFHDLVRGVQAPILPRYGFKASDAGVCEMITAIDALNADSEISALAAQIDEAIFGASRARGERLTEKSVTSLLSELLFQYSTQEFQSKVRQLREMATRDPAIAVTLNSHREELALTVQAKILPKYGLEGSHKGAHTLAQHCAKHCHKPEVHRLLTECNKKLGMTASESRRDLDRLSASSSRMTTAAHGRGRAVVAQPSPWEGDATGTSSNAAAIADAPKVKKTFTKARAQALLTELMAASLEPSGKRDDPNASACAALERYGFEGNREGLHQMRHAIEPWLREPDVGKLAKKVSADYDLSDVLVQAGRPTEMSKEAAVRLLNELLQGYSEAGVQKRLSQLHREHAYCGPNFVEQFSEVVRTVQADILPKYGLAFDEETVRAPVPPELGEHFADKDIQVLCASIDEAICMMEKRLQMRSGGDAEQMARGKVVQILREKLSAFYGDEFQESVERLRGAVSFAQGRAELALSVERDILERHGLSGDERGVHTLLTNICLYIPDPEVAALMDAVHEQLGMALAESQALRQKMLMAREQES